MVKIGTIFVSTLIHMDDWKGVFQQQSLHEIRAIVYDTRSKATAKKAELRSAVR